MAAEAPDPKTFGSWEDAFQYPIAAVRGMERQLRNDINSNREKLRSLVGASYRDLLGTAESIVEMDGQIQKVDFYLGDIGTKCNSRLLEKKAANLNAWNNHSKAADRERYILASQLAVLRSCPEVISRLLKTAGSVLLVAKALVISRLLHKKLSLQEHPPPYLETLRNRLATLRRKLLARIDRQLQSLESPDAVLVETMCAFSLATSSSLMDVLRHFHHVRQAALSELGQRNEDNRGPSKSLSLIIKTLGDCQGIFPAQLARALESLKATPLLHSSDVQSLQRLNLDIHQRWLGEDINSFIPYVRHDDLHKMEATRLLEQWAKHALSSFLRDLRAMIEKDGNPTIIVQLRQEMLHLWLSNKSHFRGIGTSNVFDGIRDAFNGRLRSLIHQHTTKLSDIGALIGTLLRTWKSGVSDACAPMWDDAIISMDTASGGQALRDALSIRASGRSEPVKAMAEAYASWLYGVNELEQMMTKLQEKKWTDEIDDMEDDEDTLEDLQNTLSEDDPHLLHKTLEDNLEDSFEELRNAIQVHAGNLEIHGADTVVSAHKATFLLRTWRDISNRLPSIYRDLELETSFTPMLQKQVSRTALHHPISQCDRGISKALHHKQLQARALWEGEPQLPLLPLPWTFKLLHETVKSMAGFGVDIWTPQAVNVLKQQFRDAMAPIVKKLLEEKRQMNGDDTNGDPDDEPPPALKENSESDHPNGNDEDEKPNVETSLEREPVSKSQTNGDTPSHLTGPSNGVIRDMRIQRLFDAMYLDYATTINRSVSDDVDSSSMLPDRFDSAQSYLLDDLAEFPDEWFNRMRKNAEAYWKRTELLFALLA
ncbi:MAG: hypothetical protein Q9200_007354 [Gallowayella weberi]